MPGLPQIGILLPGNPTRGQEGHTAPRECEPFNVKHLQTMLVHFAIIILLWREVLWHPSVIWYGCHQMSGKNETASVMFTNRRLKVKMSTFANIFEFWGITRCEVSHYQVNPRFKMLSSCANDFLPHTADALLWSTKVQSATGWHQ